MEHHRGFSCVGRTTRISKCTLQTQGGAIGKVSTKPAQQVEGRLYSQTGDSQGACICSFKQSKSTIPVPSCFFKIKTDIFTHMFEFDWELIEHSITIWSSFVPLRILSLKHRMLFSCVSKVHFSKLLLTCLSNVQPVGTHTHTHTHTHAHTHMLTHTHARASASLA